MKLPTNQSLAYHVYLNVYKQMTDVKLFLVHSSAWGCLCANKQLKVNRMICIGWRYVKSFNCGKNKLGLCLYWVEFFVLCSCAWSRLIVCRQVSSGSFAILSTKYSFGNLRFDISKGWHWIACRGLCAISPTNQRNQPTKLEKIEFSKKTATFSPKSGQI